MSRLMGYLLFFYAMSIALFSSATASTDTTVNVQDIALNAAQNVIDIVSHISDVTIMPLGGRTVIYEQLSDRKLTFRPAASIVYGYGSTTGNGFRLDTISQLNEKLSPKVFACVGDISSGNSSHSAYSGSVAWPGRVLTQVQSNASKYLDNHACPKITLVHAGTNDMVFNLDRKKAPQRLGSLLDDLFDYCPDMSIFVAQLIPSKIKTVEQAIETFNSEIPAIVDKRANEGRKIVTVDMHSVVQTKNLYDRIHPNDHGYLLMANTWVEAVVTAEQKGWF
ncbi:putative fg-gap repeat domain-containing protein [Phaeomoniella chlamydospora]|uniref:Putative fg-gap repeat domain-containing protein n=1 Tax=Phaeomoniella chlamydospora TaxID=158046 RepID=A0A0G2GQW3_PHACM|nr:putative fg-gap repeat domain-containing protein [Phaeomoniella chlamydospora]